jgi:fumarate hydratase class II
MSPATRMESDSMGEIAVPVDALWGAQTQRSLEHFAISTERMPDALLMALARIKRVAARVNGELGLLDATTGSCHRAGRRRGAGGGLMPMPSPVRVADRFGHPDQHEHERGAGQPGVRAAGRGPRAAEGKVHPNDHVNRGQSSNDIFPTAMHVAACVALSVDLLPALDGLARHLEAKAQAWADIVKIGRTHLQDATPLTLGQEISGWVAQLARREQAIAR